MLGRRWFGQARIRPEPEEASDTYARWVLLHLFFITLMPFSTQIVGRYEFAPAIWLYAANTILAALVAIRLTYLAESGVRPAATPTTGGRNSACWWLRRSLSVIVSFFDAGWAMLAYFLNFAAPVVHRWAKYCIKTSSCLCFDA